ncbi:phytoene desaturase family protein [Gordonia hankookensis]|uniref:NAD(P)/FAD-dependent oxidoreductase n=1 Tax=Gordonia hankookensis TaxID=589403 RepID=A0ABR7WEG4_9ACTN|nr:NAD(P)/FAD-dependent oxidoreductase [Gordonia hankookensis]MBD1320267.1 NAD(P)/FAD-dependent oxidoreductase [Gordonia hankookensis]
MTSAVVVGSGPNGLTAGVVLARAGCRVHVIEAADAIGGGARSAELLRPGVVHDLCSAFHPIGAGSPALRSLGLDRHGLRWRWPEIDCAHPLDEGPAALLHRSVADTADGLGEDRATWRDMIGGIAADFDELADDLLGPLVAMPRHPIKLAEFGHRALYPATGVARVFRTAQARALFGGVAAHAFTRLDRPGSAAPGLVLLAAGHRHGWPVAQGGSGAIVTALASALIDAGGTITTGQEVTSIDEVDSADVVLLDVMPAAAAGILADRLSGRRSRRYLAHRHGPAAFKVDYLVDGDIGWTDPDCGRAGTVHLGGTFDEIVAAENDVVAGRMPARPFTLVGQQWLADPTRATGSLRPLWAYAHVPHGFTGDATPAVTAQIERFAPGFRAQIVDSISTSPAQLQQQNANHVGGDIGGGRNDLTHLIARPRLSPNPYDTGVPGVYLCSSATPPGGGVHGMCGRNAAEAALRYLNR